MEIEDSDKKVKIKYLFAFGAHVTKGDALFFTNLIEKFKPHIVALEAFNIGVVGVSELEKSLETGERVGSLGGFGDQIFSVAHRRGIKVVMPITSILPALVHSGELGTRVELYRSFGESSFLKGEWSEAAKYMRDYLVAEKELIEYNEKRFDLSSFHFRVVRKAEELEGTIRELRVLAMFGLGHHERFFKEFRKFLKNQEIDAETEKVLATENFPSLRESTAVEALKKEGKHPTEDDALSVVLEQLLYNLIKDLSDFTVEVDKTILKISEKVNTETIIELSKYTGTPHRRFERWAKRTALSKQLLEFFSKRGIQIPKNNSELKKMIE